MKQIANLVVGLAFILVLSLGLRHVFNYVTDLISGPDVRGLVMWRFDFDGAVAEAAGAHKPVLVEFERRESKACQELAKKGWLRGDVVNATGGYVPVLVDIDSNPELAKRFQIATVPSLVVLDEQTQQIVKDGRDSSISGDELLYWLNPNAQPTCNLKPFDQSNLQGNGIGGQGFGQQDSWSVQRGAYAP